MRLAPIPVNWPPPLMTSDPGSFARATIIERKPKIIQQVIDDHHYLPEILAALESFRDEIAGRPLQPIRESASDVDFWNGELAAYAGKTWLEVPWYFAETFFYRKLLEATRYFQPGVWQGIDPFQQQKDRQIVADVAQAASWDTLDSLEPRQAFEALLHSCLWGNRTDLSNFTVKLKGKSGMETRDERTNILIDHTDSLYTLLSTGIPRVDFINDNVGADLLSDLALTDSLLHHGWVETIVFHLKPQPFFVSDAMIKDAQATVEALVNSSAVHTYRLGRALQSYLTDYSPHPLPLSQWERGRACTERSRSGEGGRLHFVTDPFWATCLMFRQMPASLQKELAQSSLIILKGDVNYRRLLDDRHWPHTARMEIIARYFPAPFVTLRTLKGEIMVSLQPGQAERIAAEDPTWLINGKRGVIQLITR